MCVLIFDVVFSFAMMRKKGVRKGGFGNVNVTMFFVLRGRGVEFSGWLAIPINLKRSHKMMWIFTCFSEC